MKRLQGRHYLAFTAMVVFFVKSPTIVEAQQASLTLSPLLTHIRQETPSLAELTFHLTNETQTPLEVTCRLVPFVVNGERGEVSYTVGSITNDTYQPLLSAFSLFDTANNPITTLVLAAKQKKSIVLKGVFDKPLNSTEYTLSLLCASNTPSIADKKNSTSTLSLGSASHIVLSVGKNQPQLQVEEFSTPYFINGNDVPFVIRVKNLSGHATEVSGEVTIQNILGQTASIKLAKTFILSHTTKRVFGEKAKDLRHESFSWHNSFPLTGSYTAKLELQTTDSATSTNAQTFFFGFPLLPLGIIFLVLFLLALIKRRLRLVAR